VTVAQGIGKALVWYNTGVDLLTTSVATVESDGEPYTLLELVGEADVTNSDSLRQVLDAEVAKQPRTLIFDLSGLRFMDSSALHVILRASRAMDRQGGILALACAREPVAKMLRLTAADQLIPVYASVSEASAG